jgi:hypothetical protein
MHKTIDSLPDFAPDEIAAIRCYVRHVRQLALIEEGAQLHVETSFEFPVPSVPQADGNVWLTADACVYLPVAKHLHVVDYKHGVGVDVVAEDNDQTKAYALGAVNALGVPVSKITVHIVQPRSRDSDEFIKEWTFDAIDVFQCAEDWTSAIRESVQNPTRAVPGCHCHFCKGDGICEERAVSVLEGVVELPSTDVKETFGLPEPNRLDDTQIAAIFLNSAAIRQFLKAVENQAFSRRLAGQMENCGVKLIRTLARREWKPGVTNADVALELADLGVPMKRTFDIVYPSPNQADELLTEFIHDPDELKAAKMKFAVELTKKESSGLKLAPSSAKGKEIDPAAENTQGLDGILPPPA